MENDEYARHGCMGRASIPIHKISAIILLPNINDASTSDSNEYVPDDLGYYHYQFMLNNGTHLQTCSKRPFRELTTFVFDYNTFETEGME